MPATAQPRINLALQGGGAHGAFTWGVLDALLADGRVGFEGISGTSAGAMNAIALADGWLKGGADGARQSLETFWLAIADSSPFSSQGDDSDSPPTALKLMLGWTDYLTPEQLNPLDLNPLRDIVTAQFDFAALRRDTRHKLFIAATHANTGKLRLFRNAELSAEALLASACLPMLHRTVIIDGEPYWDGGYSANPAVFPLLFECQAEDNLLVLLTPLHLGETPSTAPDTRHRLREMSFNATFLREMRMFAHLREHIRPNRVPAWLRRWLPESTLDRRIGAARFHAISADALMHALPADSKLTVNRSFFLRLRDQGRAHAQGWLAGNHAAIGRRSTLDLAQAFY